MAEQVASEVEEMIEGRHRQASVENIFREIDFEKECLTLIPEKVKLRKGIQVTPWFHEDFAEPLSKLWKKRGKPQEGLVWPRMAEAHEKVYSWPFTEWREILEHKDVGLKVSRDPKPGEKRRGKVLVNTFHSLRHTYVTQLLEAGSSLEDVAIVVGHGSPVMTSNYDHSRAVWERVRGKVPGLR